MDKIRTVLIFNVYICPTLDINKLNFIVMDVMELQINNWVIDDEGNNVIIEQISSDRIHEFVRVSRLTEKGHRLFYASNVLPIQLTEEVLLKCGFEISEAKFGGKRASMFGFGLGLSPVEFCFDNDGNLVFGAIVHGWSASHVKTVHQLQNLILSITGQGLTITL